MHKLTVTEWGRQVGISKQAAFAAVKRCSIPVENGQVDVEVATALYRSRTRSRVKSEQPAAAGLAAPPPDGGQALERITYDEARRRQAVAEALMSERAERLQAGELIEVQAVRHAHGRRLAALREALLQIPARVAPVLAAETEQARCHDVVQRELHSVLRQVSDPASER
jgi:hypothetical protein